MTGRDFLRVLEGNANYEEYRVLMSIEEFTDVMRNHTCQDRQSETRHKLSLLS